MGKILRHLEEMEGEERSILELVERKTLPSYSLSGQTESEAYFESGKPENRYRRFEFIGKGAPIKHIMRTTTISTRI